MSDPARLTHKSIRESIEEHLRVRVWGPNGEPLVTDDPDYERVRRKVCGEVHRALDASQKQLSPTEGRAQTPDQLAKHVYREIEEQQVQDPQIKYTMDWVRGN